MNLSHERMLERLQESTESLVAAKQVIDKDLKDKKKCEVLLTVLDESDETEAKVIRQTKLFIESVELRVALIESHEKQLEIAERLIAIKKEMNNHEGM